MIRPLILFGLIILLEMSCNKSGLDDNLPNKDSSSNYCDTNRFYYYGSEKIKLKEVPNKITLSFYDTLSFDTISKFVKQFNAIHFYLDSFKTNIIYGSIDSSTCEGTDSLISTILKNNKVSNCDKFFYQDGAYLGLTDLILCKFKINPYSSEINDLLARTKTKLVRYNSSIGYYLIRVDKNSTGDALDISDEFFESGYFVSAEPDFLMLLRMF